MAASGMRTSVRERTRTRQISQQPRVRQPRVRRPRVRRPWIPRPSVRQSRVEHGCRVPRSRYRRTRVRDLRTGAKRRSSRRCSGWLRRGSWLLPGRNPCRSVRLYKQRSCDRFLTPDEYRRLGRALREAQADGLVSPAVVAAIRLLVFTGCRHSEILLSHQCWQRRRARLWSLSPRMDEISLPLTQRHIGDPLGLTNVHVNRMLRELRDEGVLNLKIRVLRILDACVALFPQWRRPNSPKSPSSSLRRCGALSSPDLPTLGVVSRAEWPSSGHPSQPRPCHCQLSRQLPCPRMP